MSLPHVYRARAQMAEDAGCPVSAAILLHLARAAARAPAVAETVAAEVGRRLPAHSSALAAWGRAEELVPSSAVYGGDVDEGRAEPYGCCA